MIERLHAGRRWLVASVLVLAVVAAGGAYAGHQDANVVSYTGCLNISGDSAGNVLRIKAGDSPLKPCGSGQVQFHFSGGDISAVRTPDGSGLTGGSENGAVTLGLTAQQKLPSCTEGNVPGWNGSAWVCYTAGTGLEALHNTWQVAPGYRLPQGCGLGQVAKVGMSAPWLCAPDNDTTYSAGTGLDLSGTQFSVDPPYRLPQGCSSGQVAKRDGSGSWTCANDEDSGFPPAFAAGDSGVTDGGTVISKTPPAGTYLIFAKVVAINTSTSIEPFVHCELKVGGVILDEVSNQRVPEATSISNPEEVIELQADASVDGSTAVSVTCGPTSSITKFAFRKLNAIRVSSVG